MARRVESVFGEENDLKVERAENTPQLEIN
jgi:hypothetical protein